jgi:dipeptidase E
VRLILSGGGDSENFIDLDKQFLSLLSDNPNLLLIPMAGEPSTYNDALERIVETFSTINFENIEMCLELETLTWNYLKQFDAIYIDGGNTFRLMDHVRKSHFYELVRKFIHKGGVINGDSAGAIILGSHLETAHFGDEGDENDTELISYQGLNLLGDIAIHCHYQDIETNQINDFVNEYGLSVIALYEESGISIVNKELMVLGNTSVDFYSLAGKVKVLPGQSISLI